MAQPDHARFPGRCKAIFIGVRPHTRRELAGLLTRHFPQAAFSDLPGDTPLRDVQAHMQGNGAGPLPRLLLIELDGPGDSKLDLIPAISQADPRLIVIAILKKQDPDLVLRCLRMGATDFLMEPFTAEQMEAAAAKVIRSLPQGQTPASPGKVYCLMPVKGACGATTLACNLAFQLKRLGAKRLLLADLDPLTGIVSFLLKVKCQYSFIDVLQRAADIDEDLWKVMVTNQNGIDVLLSPESLIDCASELTDPGPIIEYARANYEAAIVDAGSPYDEWNLALAHASDEILLVTTNELASLNSAQRVLSYLDANGLQRWKIKLIVNRYDKKVGLSEEMIPGALQTEVAHVLPSDYATVHQALLEGKPIPGSSEFGKSMAALAERLSGRTPAPKKSASFTGLFSMFSRTSM